MKRKIPAKGHGASSISRNLPLNSTFRKSKLSASTDCVEVAQTAKGEILVRDSKDPKGATLRFTQSEWLAFTGGVRNGEFDI